MIRVGRNLIAEPGDLHATNNDELYVCCELGASGDGVHVWCVPWMGRVSVTLEASNDVTYCDALWVSEP